MKQRQAGDIRDLPTSYVEISNHVSSSYFFLLLKFTVQKNDLLQ